MRISENTADVCFYENKVNQCYEKTFVWVLFDVTRKNQFIGFACGFIYVCVVFIIRQWMKTRPKFELKNVAAIWNTLMLILSIAGTIGLLPTLVQVLIRQNFYSSICTDRTCHYSMFCGLWLGIFPWLKIIELGDTILIVLQKRELAPYYFCHHLGILIISWYIYPTFPPSIISWIGALVYFSHIFIYLFLTTRYLGFSAPHYVPEALLVSEILHMMMGVILCSFIYYYTFVGDFCGITVLNGSIMFFGYLLCFFLSSMLYYKKFYMKSKTRYRE